MANYRFFNILHPQEAGDPLYPVLDSNFTPVFTPDDGDQIEDFPIRGMFVLGSAGDNTLKILSGSRDLKGTLWLTSQRAVVVCRNYDQVKWDNTNSVNTAFFGIGTELTWHLAEKAVHKVKSSGKAMAAHVYYPWIESVECRPEQSKKILGHLRMGAFLDLTTGKFPLSLELQCDSDVDTTNLARNLLQRIASWYTNCPVELSESQRQRAAKDAAKMTLNTYQEGRKYSTLHSVSLRTSNTPSAIAERANQASEKDRRLQEARAARINAFKSNMAHCRPRCELVESTDEGRENFTSELGIVVARGKGIRAVATEHTFVHMSGELHGNYLANPDTGAPADEGERIRLHQGQAQFLVTNKRLVVVTKGKTAAGDLTRKRAGVLIASTPIEKIDIVGRFKSFVPQRTDLDIFITSRDPLWGGLFASSINGERSVDGDWTYEDHDLANAALRIASAVSEARNLPSPQLGEGNFRLAYLISTP